MDYQIRLLFLPCFAGIRSAVRVCITSPTYTPGTNRLRDINGGADDYTYDPIGSQTSDATEDITSIEWTVYGKVAKVTKNNGGTVIAYTYDAMGQRVQKSVNGITTTYPRDASGNVMCTYEGEVAQEWTICGSSRLGVYRGGREVGQRKTGLKNYELSNHLGNVLAVISDKKVLVSDYFIADVVSATDYYPFGYAMPKREYQSSGYRYGFNGKENDTEIGWQDYGERMYAPKICRFPSADPLIIYGQQYPELSSYQFAGNTPIWAVDLDGLEPALATKISPNGNISSPKRGELNYLDRLTQDQKNERQYYNQLYQDARFVSTEVEQMASDGYQGGELFVWYNTKSQKPQSAVWVGATIKSKQNSVHKAGESLSKFTRKHLGENFGREGNDDGLLEGMVATVGIGRNPIAFGGGGSLTFVWNARRNEFGLFLNLEGSASTSADFLNTGLSIGVGGLKHDYAYNKDWRAGIEEGYASLDVAVPVGGPLSLSLNHSRNIEKGTFGLESKRGKMVQMTQINLNLGLSIPSLPSKNLSPIPCKVSRGNTKQLYPIKP